MGIPVEKCFDVKGVASNVTIKPSDPLISDAAMIVYQYICYTTISPMIDIFGVVTNIINMICFIKQGFKDSVNVSLFGLAISDLGCIVTLIWLNISLTPAFQQQNLPFEQMDTQYLTASWPHVIFSRISSFITAFITLERCLCITVPLKVKLIFTSKRVAIIIASGFIIFILSICPVYCVNIYTHVYFPTRNRTILAIIRMDNHKWVEQVLFTVNVIVQFSTYLTVIVCTAVLICKLQRKTKWRQTVSSGVSDNLTSRDQKVAQMILLISTVFIISFVPNCATFVGMALEKELAIEGRYKNTLVVMFGFGVILESINSAVNIFIYYKISTKYRVTFRILFRLQPEGQHDRPLTVSSQRFRKPLSTGIVGLQPKPGSSK